jgi:L-glyceraldehyde 3-phosphate reductase
VSYEPATTRYDSLDYVAVGRSGLKLPRISLGLWNNFGDDRPLERQRAIVRRAFDRGVTHFDLANNYGPPIGSAEANFGRLVDLDLRPFRDELVISTKAGYTMGVGPYQDGGSRKYVLSSLDASLGRLGLDYVDIFYSHRYDPSTPLEETMGALATAVTSGRALYAGISNYSPEKTREAAAILDDLGVPLLIHQPSYSMFNRRNEPLFPVFEELGIGSIVFSPLAQGLLTERYIDGTIPDGSRASEGRWLKPGPVSATYLERVRAIRDIAQGRGQTLAQLALSWVLRVPQVTSALIGASSVAQLDDNLDALNAPALTADEIAALEPFAVDGTGLHDD